jgi:hypothetical protein
VKPKGGGDAGFGCSINAKNRTFLMEMIIVEWAGGKQIHNP